MDSPENTAVISEAIERMDSYVDYRDGQFTSRRATAERLDMSEELFTMLQSMMKQSNEMIKGYYMEHRVVEVKPNVLRIVDEAAALAIIRTRGLGEDPLPPGSDGWDARWYGADIYLSNSTLRTISQYSNGAAVAAAVAAAMGANAPGWLVSGAFAVGSVLSSNYANNCPNGVRVTCIPGAGGLAAGVIAILSTSCQ